VDLSLSRTKTRISVPAHAGPGPRGRRGCSETGPLGRNVIDIETSQAYLDAEDQIGLAVSPPVPERSQCRGRDRNGGNGGKEKERRLFEIADWSDEPTSDREDIQRLGRARTS